MFPSWSTLFKSAFIPGLLINALTKDISNLTTARCIALPKIPPPKFISSPGVLIRIYAPSKLSSLIAKHNGVQLSLSSILVSAFPNNSPSKTPLSFLKAALWSGVLVLLSQWLISNTS